MLGPGILLLVALTGCGPAVSGQALAAPASQPSPAAPPGARAYNEPMGAPVAGEPADRLTALVARVAKAEGRAVPTRDARLDLACTSLAKLLPEEGTTPFDLVEFVLRHSGIVEPVPHLLVATVSDAALPAFEDDIQSRLPKVLASGRYRRLGIGIVRQGDASRIVLCLQETFITLEPIPRHLPHGGRAALRGRVQRPFLRPRIFITTPDGKVTRLAAKGRGGRRIKATLVCAGDGVYQVEVTGDDRHGATVLANFPVYCGVPAPARPPAAAAEEAPVTDEASAAARLLELLNADRKGANLPTLRWDAELADVALAHSRDMMTNNFVGHISPTTGDAPDRIERARLPVALVLENVARAYSLSEAERGLMQSPGHRANILNREVTKVGIGVAIGRAVGGRRELFITQLFTKPAR